MLTTHATADVRFYDDLDAVPMPAPKTLNQTHSDEEVMLPLVARYYQQHPYTVLNEVDLSVLALSAMDRAEIEVNIQAQSKRQTLTNAERSTLVDELAWMLMTDAAARDELCALNVHELELRDQRHEEVMRGLTDIKQSVDRSAVVANMMDKAMQHPFLLGFFGRGFLNSIISSFGR